MCMFLPWMQQEGLGHVLVHDTDQFVMIEVVKSL